MAKYILNSNIYLRSYADHPRCVYNASNGEYYDVSSERFSRLLACDGKSEVQEDEAYSELVSSGLIHSAAFGEELFPAQRFKYCANILLKVLVLEITERCNFNCRHCFNAEGVKVPRAELALDEIRRILDEAFECGVNNVVLTGGEPMLHPGFTDIVRYVADKGMRLAEINTNGSLITAEILELLVRLGMKPMMKISFDGIGFHNWMRGMDSPSLGFSAEENALSAMRLCIRYGLKVFVQMNLNKKNLGCMLESIDMLDEMGVMHTRIIRTSEAPRWLENAADALLSWNEYFDACLEIAKHYLSRERKMSLKLWFFLFVHSKKKLLYAEKCAANGSISLDDQWLCGGKLAICASGELYPCMQMTGWMKANGITLGNIKNTPLEKLLSSSPYLSFVTCTKGDKARNSAACGSCPFVKYCGGGCPAISVLMNGSYYGRDDSSCIFFRDGYYAKLKELAPAGFTVYPPMDESLDSAYLKQFTVKQRSEKRERISDHRALLAPSE